MDIKATERIVDPQTGEVLAERGEVNPGNLLERLDWFCDAGKEPPSWLLQGLKAVPAEDNA